MAKNELAKNELAKNELAKNELAKNELAKNELAKNELAKNEMAKNEMAKNEMAKKPIGQKTDWPKNRLAKKPIGQKTDCPKNRLSKKPIVQKTDCPKNRLAKNGRAQNTMAKNGLAKNGLSRWTPPDYWDAGGIALEMPDHPNVWTDGSKENFSSLGGFEVAGAGVYLPASELAFENLVWGTVEEYGDARLGRCRAFLPGLCRRFSVLNFGVLFLPCKLPGHVIGELTTLMLLVAWFVFQTIGILSLLMPQGCVWFC